jgi:hypothetical protein
MAKHLGLNTEDICKLRQRGFSYSRISDHYHCNDQSIVAHVRKARKIPKLVEKYPAIALRTQYIHKKKVTPIGVIRALMGLK